MTTGGTIFLTILVGLGVGFLLLLHWADRRTR